MKVRLAQSGDKSEVKAVRREVAQIYTKGTHYNMTGKVNEYDTKYVMALYQRPDTTNFGYCYFDMSTLKFHLGHFEDDFTLKGFRTLAM